MSGSLSPTGEGRPARPAPFPSVPADRDLAVEIEAESASVWTFRFRRSPGEAVDTVERQPPVLGDELRTLFQMAGAGLPLDENGELSKEGREVEAAMQGLARQVGAVVTALLPEGALRAVEAVAGSAATLRAGILRLRVTGTRGNDALLLPWELLQIHDAFPVAQGNLHLLREAVLPGVEGFPAELPPLSVVSHISAPVGDEVAELNLEEAAYRMARALDPLRDRTRFTELGSLDDLESAARAVKPVLLHFSGHGGPGCLYFEDDECRPDEVSVNELTLRLSQAMGRLPLAIWLSCCYGAGAAESAASAPRKPGQAGGSGGSAREWGVLAPESRSVAADLHRRGVPQILGYFGPVPDDLAVVVDRTLFEDLLETGSSLEATRRARLRAQDDIDGRKGLVRFPLAWTLLGLYHRGPDRPLTRPVERDARVEMEGLRPDALWLEGVEVLRHGFLGRRRLLAEFRKLRRQGEHALGLYGLGGLGKTATLTRLASLLTGGGPGWEKKVIVIPANEIASSQSEAAPIQLFRWLVDRVHRAVSEHPDRPNEWERDFARLDEIESPNDQGAHLAGLVLKILKKGSSILYIDNAETLQVGPEGVTAERVPWAEPALAAFFETLCGADLSRGATVLLTTRYRPAETPGRWLEIRPCSEGEIFRMTAWVPALRRLPVVLREELATERLAGHPRAVRFVDGLVRKEEEKRIDDGYDGFDSHHSPEQVRQEILAPALAGLPKKIDQDLALAAVLDSLEAEPRALLGEGCAIGLPVPLELVRELGKGVETLKARGLLTRFEGRTEGWAVHPFVRESAAAQGDLPKWTIRGRATLGEYWDTRGREDRSADELKEALQHLVAGKVWVAAAGAIRTLSEHYYHVGWVRARLDLLEGLSSVLWPSEAKWTWVYELGVARLDIGDYEGCESALRDSIVLGTAINGNDRNAQVAASLAGLGNVLFCQGRYVEAEVAYQKSIGIQESVCGSRRHAQIAACLAGLGNVQSSRGLYVEAEQSFRESTAILRALYGTRQRPEVADSLHGLGNVLLSRGRYEEAEGLYRDSIGIQEMVRGTRQHAKVAASLYGLATVLNCQGRNVESEEFYRELIGIQEMVYGTRQHAEVAASLGGLANVLVSQHRYLEAEGLYRDSIRIQDEVYGTRLQKRSATALNGLANILLLGGRHSEAEELYRESIEIQEAMHGTRQHPGVAAPLSGLANAVFLQGRHVESERLHREAIEIQEAVYGTRQHAKIAASLSGLANALMSQDRYAEAQASYTESIEIQEAVYGTRHHAEVAASLHGLANAQAFQGHYVDAESLYLESIGIKTNLYGTRRHAKVVASLYRLANALVFQRRDTEAEELYRESIVITELMSGTRQSAEIANSLYGLANVLLNRQDLDGAVLALEEVVAIEEKVFGSRRTRKTVPTLDLLAQIFLGRGYSTVALSYARDAWRGALENKEWLMAVDVGPTYFEALFAENLQEEAEVLTTGLLGFLFLLPRDHPSRLRAAKMLGLNNDTLYPAP